MMSGVIATLLRRAIEWLRRLLSPDTRVIMMPGDACAHTGDPHATMIQLLRSVHDPQKFAELLGQSVNCPGCSTALVSELVYELAGLIWDADPQDVDDQPLEEATCDCQVSPEVVALRLALSLDADDGAALGMALAQVWGCQSCLLSVVLALTRAHVTVMDDPTPSWRPVLERRLLWLLDQATGT